MTSTDPLRVLHITDPHLFADGSARLRGTVTSESLADVLRHVEDSGWRPDLVAMTGDVIQDDSRTAYERFRKLLAPLGLPVHCVPGNHDLPRLMQDALDHERFHYCATRIYGRWLIAGIDSTVEGAAAGRVSERELERLQAALEDTPAEHAAVCLHHPPLPVGSRWLDEVGLENGGQFLEGIAVSGKVRLVVFGHVHQAFEGTSGGMRILGTPSTCTQFELHSESYAVSDQPPAYRRIALSADGSVDTELVWLEEQRERTAH